MPLLRRPYSGALRPTAENLKINRKAALTLWSRHRERQAAIPLSLLLGGSFARNATKCGDSSHPRRTEAELSPHRESNVPNLLDVRDHIAADNS
jgi:hypothetical protein